MFNKRLRYEGMKNEAYFRIEKYGRQFAQNRCCKRQKILVLAIVVAFKHFNLGFGFSTTFVLVLVKEVF